MMLTGQSETIGTARHPFWVTDLGPQNPLAPLADVEQPHNGATGATYAHSLSDITDRHLDARVVKQGWVLTLADGRRIVVESARLTTEAMAAAAGDTAIERIEPVILGTAGWVFSSHLRPGVWLAAAHPLGLRLDAVRVEHGRVRIYNLIVRGSHTYFVGRTGAWVHNGCLFDDLAKDLSDVAKKNVDRFEKSLPKGAVNPKLQTMPNGNIRVTADVPGRVPGSFARYEKFINPETGATEAFWKVTYGPDGAIIHAKEKITGEFIGKSGEGN